MNLAKLIAPLAGLFMLAACAASTQAPSPDDIYYATPEVAAKTSPERMTFLAPSTATVSDAQRPYVLGPSGLVPAAEPDTTTPPPIVGKPNPKCNLCIYEDYCGPICCPGEPHCQLYAL